MTTPQEVVLTGEDVPGWMRKLVVPSMIGLMAGIVLQFFKLFASRPEQGIELLKAWGPASLLGTLALAVIAGLMSQLMDISRDGVQAQRQMADAMGRIAEKDDRRYDEMQRMSQYSAQQSERVLEIIKEQSSVIRELSGDLKEHGKRLEQLQIERAKGASA